MDEPTASTTPTRGPQPQKRAAILRAARAVFGRDGYARAGVDAIAGEAGVSTRTLYKHFGGKQQLFAVVLEESAGEVADGFAAHVERGMREATDGEAQLVVLGRAMLQHRADHPEHFAMVRQINVEAPHFPDAVIEAWQDAGPRRVRAMLAAELERLAGEGLLVLPDRDRGVRQFVALVTADVGTRSYEGGSALSDAEATEMVEHGVRTFLYGYTPREG